MKVKVLGAALAVLAVQSDVAEAQSTPPAGVQCIWSANNQTTTTGVVSLPPIIDPTITGTTAACGSAMAWPANVYSWVLKSGSVIAACTITLPICDSTTANNGQSRSLSVPNGITILTVNAVAGTVSSSTFSIAAGGGAIFKCLGADATWYKFAG